MISVNAKLEGLGVDINTLEMGVVDVFRRAIAGLAKASQSEWIRLAQTRLKTSREIYINGLRQAESFTTRTDGGEPVYEITLVGTMPNNIEHGMPSFDMKNVRPGWLGGSKSKVGKDGKRYVIIPFRHSTSSDARLGYTGKAKDANLQTHLKKAVSQYGLDKMIRSASGQVKSGPVKRIPKGADVHKYLQGLTRIQKPTGTTKQRGQGMLMTWRVMSENSKPSAWIHPGIKAHNILKEVERFADQELDKIVNATLEV